MWPLYAIVALFLAPCPSRAALQRDVDDSLQKIFDVRLTARNDTGRAAEIPGYMYRLYQDASYRRYDVIRRISPKTGNDHIAPSKHVPKSCKLDLDHPYPVNSSNVLIVRIVYSHRSHMSSTR